MKVLVTGATGFLGNHVIDELLKHNIEVVATARTESKARTFSWYNNVDFIPFDINNSSSAKENLFNYFGNPDKLLHLAWENLPNYTELFHIEKNLMPNYCFLKNLTEGGLKDLTVTGTCLEYGMQEGCLSETMTSSPESPYAIAKDTLRKFIDVLSKHHLFYFKWVRLFYMYGVGQSEKSLFTQLEKAIESNVTEFKMSGGEQVRDFMPVERAASNLRKIILSDENYRIVNCCSGEPQTVKSFVENHLRVRNREMKLILGHYPYPDYEPMKFWGDITKLNSIIERA